MNSMSREKRRYELKARAATQRQTRERIVQATVDLHREVGPARTTVAEIARRAGVQRLTVYNHFPEEAGRFGACQARWLQLHPLDRKSTRLNSSHANISYAVFCLKKKKAEVDVGHYPVRSVLRLGRGSD